MLVLPSILEQHRITIVWSDVHLHRGGVDFCVSSAGPTHLGRVCTALTGPEYTANPLDGRPPIPQSQSKHWPVLALVKLTPAANPQPHIQHMMKICIPLGSLIYEYTLSEFNVDTSWRLRSILGHSLWRLFCIKFHGTATLFYNNSIQFSIIMCRDFIHSTARSGPLNKNAVY